MFCTNNGSRVSAALPRRSFRLRSALLLASLGLAGALTGLPAVSAQHDVEVAPGRLLIEPRAGLSDAEFEKVLKPHGGKSVRRIPGTNVHIVELPANASERAVAALLKNNKHFKFVELDVLLKPELIVNDPYLGSAWHLPKIQAPTAWNTTMGANVIVAILDSGVDAAHPDFVGKLVPGWNFYGNNADTSDVYGHGTQVAGAAAASSNNALGVASVAGQARIMPVRVTDSAGQGYLSQMAQGITWAADRGARVANLSFAGAGGYSTVQSAAQYMKNKGGIVVTAAGNYGRAETFAPSATTLVVSATDGNDVKASWSSYGSFVDIAAPGTGIWTTTRGGSYAAASGTSVASPVAAGVVALIVAANPGLASGDVENVLLASAVDLGAAGSDAYYGRGRVNAAAAVQAALQTVARDTSAPTVAVSSPAGGAIVKGLVAVDVAAADNVGVARVDLAVNGATVASDAGAPYALIWDSAQVADGAATLTATAYDAAGNYASSSVSVKVANSANSADAIAPTVAIASPLANARVSGTVAVRASASDNVGVATLKLYIDGQLRSTVSGGVLAYSWNTKKLVAGTHVVRVDAVDAAGNVGRQEVQVLR